MCMYVCIRMYILAGLLRDVYASVHSAHVFLCTCVSLSVSVSSVSVSMCMYVCVYVCVCIVYVYVCVCTVYYVCV